MRREPPALATYDPVWANHAPSSVPGEPRTTVGRATFEVPSGIAGMRVLVLDDDKDTRELVGFLLEQGKADVTLASNAAEADELLQTKAFDIFVSDVGMPDEDGLSLLRRVRLLPPERGGRTPAIALTAYARGEDRSAALRAGFNTHLAKPIEPVELLLVIASLAFKRA